MAVRDIFGIFEATLPVERWQGGSKMPASPQVVRGLVGLRKTGSLAPGYRGEPSGSERHQKLDQVQNVHQPGLGLRLQRSGFIVTALVIVVVITVVVITVVVIVAAADDHDSLDDAGVAGRS